MHSVVSTGTSTGRYINRYIRLRVRVEYEYEYQCKHLIARAHAGSVWRQQPLHRVQVNTAYDTRI